MKKIVTIVGLLALLPAAIGCTMCAHPFDYSYAAYDVNQSVGHRAGSAFAPSSAEGTTQSESVLETVQMQEVNLDPPELIVPQVMASQSKTLSR